MQKREQLLTPAEENLLLSMYSYDFITVHQAQRLHYSKQSINYVGEKLGATAKKGYTEQHFLPRRSKAGRAPGIFCLSPKGMKHLHQIGYPSHKRYTPSEVDGLSYLFWAHTLAVNDFLIAAQGVEKVAPGYTLLQFRHDRELRKEPVYVSGDKQGKRVGVIPDAWLDFRVQLGASTDESRQIALVLELDRGTIAVKDMKHKMRALLRYIDGSYQEAFHTKSVTVCFATTAGEGRGKILRSWCEQVLEESKRKDDSMFFYFTTLPHPRSDLDRELDPHILFLTPVWYTPFDAEPKVLLTI